MGHWAYLINTFAIERHPLLPCPVNSISFVNHPATSYEAISLCAYVDLFVLFVTDVDLTTPTPSMLKENTATIRNVAQ